MTARVTDTAATSTEHGAATARRNLQPKESNHEPVQDPPARCVRRNGHGRRNRCKHYFLRRCAAAQGTADAAKGAEMTAGEVRKIDKDNRKITLKHDDIKSLDMPGMTMVFQVKDAALLERLKPGDKIRFAVEKGATGFLITTIEPAK